MKTASLHSAFLIGAGACAVAALATVGAGCDNRHVLGGVDDGGGGGPTDGLAPVGDAISIGGTTGSGGAAGSGGPGGSGAQDGGIIVPNDGGGLRDGAIVMPVESWTGYVENYQFPSGSDAVRISFASDPTGQLVGTVLLGNGTPPPPATDPNVGYPADLLTSGGPLIVDPASRYIAEGYGYSMRGGTVAGARLRFGVGTWELWTGWCTLQTPVPPTGQCDEPVCASTCLPNVGSMSGPNGCGLWNAAANRYDPVDCGKLALCGFGGVCMCYASGCTVRDAGTAISFDITIAGGVASGSVVGLGNHNVHFTKDP